jgi:GDPmannose 4,6-dehydratase
MKKAIITGITGQDGSYLAELLLLKGYEVYGFVRRESFENANDNFKNIKSIKDKITIIPISITDPLNLYKEISNIKPDEFYHLAAHSFVSYDMSDEINIMNLNFNSTLYIMSTIKEVNPKCKVFFAGSSEMFGSPESSPQNEGSKFNPKSMYGIAKVSSYYLLKNFRDKDSLYTSTGIMYNHESSRRGSQFVTKKIISTAVKIKHKLSDKLELGNLEAMRDWGYAPDYVYAMWLVLQQKEPSDYIISTGKLHSVRNFLETVFTYLGLDYKKYVVVNKDFYRESEKIALCGDASKIRSLGWKETKNLQEIIEEMIEVEIEKISRKKI